MFKNTTAFSQQATYVSENTELDVLKHPENDIIDKLWSRKSKT
jgi:hypothetical protein